MTDAQLLTLLPDATTRVERLTELARALSAKRHAERARLGDALERLHAAETEAAQGAAALHDALAMEHTRATTSLSAVARKVDEAHAHVVHANDGLAGTDLAGVIHHLGADLHAHLDGLHGAVVTATHSVHGAQASLTHARGAAEQAIERVMGHVREHGGVAAEAAHDLVAAIAHATDSMSHSVDHTTDTCTGHRTDFSGFIQQLIASTIRSHAHSLVEYSRDQIEHAIRPKAREAVRTVVDALVHAVSAFLSHGHDVRSHTSESRARFARMDQGVHGATSKAGHVVDQARHKRDHDPHGGSHV